MKPNRKGYVIYKAQWPLANTDGNQQVLIYPDEARQPWIYMAATPEVRERLFCGKFVKVYFLGRIIGNAMDIDKFVREEEWL